MLEQVLSPEYLAYQEAKSVLEALARDNDPPLLASDPVTPLPSAELGVRADADIPIWSDQTLRGFLESLPDAMVVIGNHGAILFVNEQTEQIFGYAREELLRRPIEILVPDSKRRGHVGMRDRYMAHPEFRPMGVNRKLFGRRKDGSEFPVDVSLSPLRTEQGTFATAVIRDISQRKREEAKFQTLVENIPAVTFFAPLDESAPELYVSPQIVKLLGFTQQEWLEDPVLWHRQLHPDDLERWNRQFAPTCARGKSFDEVYRFIAKDGRVVWVHGSASVVRENGKPSFLQGVAFDITKIKEVEETLHQAQDELRRNNEELEDRVRERTKELEHFAYVASHDLTAPLRSLKRYPEKLYGKFDGKVDTDFDDWISRTLDGAQRLEQLIQHLLHYSRVVRHDRICKPTDAGVSAWDACKNLQADIEEAGAQVTRAKLPTVMGNHEELVLLFQNLISNAVKFRDPDRPIRVEVDAKPEQDGWLFWIRDNGIGIETRYYTTRPKLFQLGVEGRLNSESKFPGNGYGLHICKKIVTGHGGDIWVESEFGKGSTFYFTLPGVPTST